MHLVVCVQPVRPCVNQRRLVARPTMLGRLGGSDDHPGDAGDAMSPSEGVREVVGAGAGVASDAALVGVEAGDDLPPPTLVPQGGIVEVMYNALRHAWVMFNNVTYEQSDLPSPVTTYEVATNDDQVAFAYEEDREDSDELWSSDFLRYTLYERGSDRFVATQGGAGVVDLREFLVEHSDCRFGLHLGNSAIEDLTIFVFPRSPRGWRFWISLQGALVQSPGFELPAMKQPSRWLYMMWPAWERYLVEVLCEGGLRRSADLGGGHPSETWRCLREPSASPPTVFALLARFGLAPRHLGGFRDDPNRERASRAFLTLLRRSSLPFAVRIVAADDLQVTCVGWVGGGGVRAVLCFHICNDGNVLVREFRAALSSRGPPASLTELVLREIFFAPELDAQETLSFPDLVTALFQRYRQAKSLLGQIFLALGKHLEATLNLEWQSLSQAPTVPLTAGRLRFVDPATHERKALEPELIKYVSANQVSPALTHSLGIAFDGSTVAGRATLTSLLVLPSGRGIVPAPQDLCRSLSFGSRCLAAHCQTSQLSLGPLKFFAPSEGQDKWTKTRSMVGGSGGGLWYLFLAICEGLGTIDWGCHRPKYQRNLHPRVFTQGGVSAQGMRCLACVRRVCGTLSQLRRPGCRALGRPWRRAGRRRRASPTLARIGRRGAGSGPACAGMAS